MIGTREHGIADDSSSISRSSLPTLLSFSGDVEMTRCYAGVLRLIEQC